MPALGIEWRHHKNFDPFTVMGDERWQDYEVEVETMLGAPGYASVMGRVEKVIQTNLPPLGYWLKVDHLGTWTLYRHQDEIAKGNTSFSTDKWHTPGTAVPGKRHYCFGRWTGRGDGNGFHVQEGTGRTGVRVAIILVR